MSRGSPMTYITDVLTHKFEENTINLFSEHFTSISGQPYAVNISTAVV